MAIHLPFPQSSFSNLPLHANSLEAVPDHQSKGVTQSLAYISVCFNLLHSTLFWH